MSRLSALALAWAAGLAFVPHAASAQAAAVQAGAPLAIAWKAPAPAAEVSWRGIPRLDGGSDAAGGILYPAPSLVGFLAAIFTHAAMSSAAQTAEQEKAQREADAVLEPYAATLRSLSAEALWRTALSPPAAPPGAQLGDGPSADGWRGEATPRFSLAPDAGTLVLDLGAKLQGPGSAPLELLVRVISTPPAVVDLRQHWAADEGRALRDSAAAMLAHALALAGQEARLRGAAPESADTPAFRTHRYRLGTLMRSERSQLLQQDCGRVVLRTLRGGLLSAPAWPPPATERPAAAASAASAAAAPTGAADTTCRARAGL